MAVLPHCCYSLRAAQVLPSNAVAGRLAAHKAVLCKRLLHPTELQVRKSRGGDSTDLRPLRLFIVADLCCFLVFCQVCDFQGFGDVYRSQALADSAELEIFNHAFQTRQAAFEVGVVSEIAKPAGVGYAWLVWVDFPRM